MHVTLDTNVLIAGLRSRNGASYQVLSDWLKGYSQACASVPLWLEYEATLKRGDIASARGFSNREIDVLLANWAANVILMELYFTWRPLNQFFVMAIAEKVSALKTAEFFQKQAEPADVKRARDLLKKVADRPAETDDAIAAEVREPPPTYQVRRKSGAKTAIGSRRRKAG